MSFLASRARGVLSRRVGARFASTASKPDPTATPIIKIIPEGKEGWEGLMLYGYYGAFIFAGIGLYYRPETSLRTWAREEAIATGWQTPDEALKDLYRHRHMKAYGEHNKTAFRRIEKELAEEYEELKALSGEELDDILASLMVEKRLTEEETERILKSFEDEAEHKLLKGGDVDELKRYHVQDLRMKRPNPILASIPYTQTYFGPH